MFLSSLRKDMWYTGMLGGIDNVEMVREKNVSYNWHEYSWYHLVIYKS